jgi:hypothetical protein
MSYFFKQRLHSRFKLLVSIWLFSVDPMQVLVLHVVAISPYGCIMKYLCNVLDHEFYHKWAVLLDPNYSKNDIRGYLKCDVAVVRKGEKTKVHESDQTKDEDDIEG